MLYLFLAWKSFCPGPTLRVLAGIAMHVNPSWFAEILTGNSSPILLAERTLFRGFRPCRVHRKLHPGPSRRGAELGPALVPLPAAVMLALAKLYQALDPTKCDQTAKFSNR